MTTPREWLRRARIRPSRGAALVIGCILSLGLLVVGEVAARALGLGTDRVMRTRGGCRGGTRALGLWSRPDCVEPFVHMVAGKPIFRVRVETDSSGRRIVPGKPEGAAAQVVFFGCSVTWGWGLEGDQTLPAVFQAERRDVSVWNLAISGFGPHDALVQMEHAEVTLRGLDRGKPTRAFFVFIPEHVARVAGDATYVRIWGRAHPRFVLEPDGSLVRRGIFYQDPVRRWVARLQTRSQLARALAPRMKFASDASRVKLTVAVLRELRRRFVSLFPGSDLTLVAFPSREEEDPLTAAARAEGLVVLDYGDMERHQLSPEDFHPDAPTVERVARALARDVPPLPWKAGS